MKFVPSRQAAALIFLSLGSSFLLAAETNQLSANPGFENGAEGWIFPEGSMGEISADAAHSGGHGLRISDASGQAGSSVTSERIAVTPGTTYRLGFSARIVSGAGMGVYLRYYEAGGSKPLASEHINIPTKQTGWTSYELKSVAPDSAETVEIWVHSYGPAQVVADFDDFTFEPVTSAALPVRGPAPLGEADMVGPDGLVYPVWKLAGVPGGIPRVATSVGPEFFQGLENQDIGARLEEALQHAALAGGGAVELPAGTFFLDRPVILRDSGVVLRGAGPDRTRLAFQRKIPRGEIQLFNWSGTGSETGAGGVLEIQANPKNLAALRVEAGGKVVKEILREPNPKGWGNRFALRFTGEELLAILPPGLHDLLATVSYTDGGNFSKTFSISLTSEAVRRVSPDQHGITVLLGPGKQGPQIPLTQDGKRGSRTLAVTAGHGLHAGDRILLEAPITERWNRLVGNKSKASRFRQYFYEIAKAGPDSLTLAQPLRIEFPVADGSFVQKAAFVERAGIEDLTIEQEKIPDDPNTQKPASLRYWYPIEDLWLDGVTSSYAWGCWIQNVKVINAGRNPLFLTRSKFCEIRDCEADGALFKGSGGTGYVGLERSFDCLMDAVTTRNMRHAPNLQWGAAGNVVRNGKFYGSDAQWHAGWTNENLLEGNLIVSTPEDIVNNNAYGYGMFATGPKDPIHGPEGPRNVAYFNDVVSPKDGLHMQGGNEFWIIVYNRFRVSDGRAVYGGEKSVGHIIRGNTFILEKSVERAVQFDSPGSADIELAGNSFYGPVTNVCGFMSEAMKFSRKENNRVLPFNGDAPRPEPPAKSLFDWQRALPSQGQPQSL